MHTGTRIYIKYIFAFFSYALFCVVVEWELYSSRRGIAFESHIKHNMGSVEIDDQVTAVKHLVQQVCMCIYMCM